MRILSLQWLILTMLVMLSCQNNHEEVLQRFDQLKSQETEPYAIAYAYTTYLSTTSSIQPEEAVPLILELISLDYHTEARYCVDNLMRNGIHSWDLLAMRGLCYFNELQPELALIDLENAHAGDPGNAKIKALIDQVKGSEKPVIQLDVLLERAGTMIDQRQYDASESTLNQILQQDQTNHRALYFQGLIRLQRGQYDSALHFMTFARSSENLEEYGQYITWIEKVLNGEDLIATNPGSFSGYIQKSQALASMGLYDPAQKILTSGLEKNPDNLNLILAKALVWVQAGQKETARQYLQELEQRGVKIDPALKQQILQNQK